ncbi:hypothetical protein ACFWJ4_18600 [Kitasatospora sp. NPDC127067]|uniref:hypothetical protein n=1 Tax=Kitasatospora sp. NPDC127067 TaxID=3347126 RepID=UPI003646F73F
MSIFTSTSNEGAALTPEGAERSPNAPRTVHNDMSGTVSGPMVQASEIGNITINYNATPPPLDSTSKRDAIEDACSSYFEPVPRSLDLITSMTLRRPPAWEYLIYVGHLHIGIKELEPRWFDYSLGYRSTGPTFTNVEDLSNHISAAFHEAADIAHRVEVWLSPDAQERAFGAPGEPGNPVLIEHLARRLVGTYGSLIEWSVSVRSISAPENLSRIVDAAAKFVDKSIREFRTFIADLLARLDQLSTLGPMAPTEPISLDFSYVMDIDPGVVKDFQAELKRAKRRQRRWF